MGILARELRGREKALRFFACNSLVYQRKLSVPKVLDRQETDRSIVVELLKGRVNGKLQAIIAVCLSVRSVKLPLTSGNHDHGKSDVLFHHLVPE